MFPSSHKIAIIEAGLIGSTIAHSLLIRRVTANIILIWKMIYVWKTKRGKYRGEDFAFNWASFPLLSPALGRLTELGIKIHNGHFQVET